MFNLFSFLIKRAARHWQILATLGLGVLLATGLLASGPVLVNTVVEFGLRRTLLTGDALDGNVRLVSYSMTTFEEEDYLAQDRAIQTAVRERLGEHVGGVVRAGGSWWFVPWLDEQLASDQRVNVGFYGGNVDGAADDDVAGRIQFVSGGWPEQVMPDASELVVRGVIGEEMAAAYDLAVGDRLPLSGDDDLRQATVWLEVAGIAQARDARDDYWFGEFSPLRARRSQRYSAQYTTLIPADDYFGVIERIAPTKRPELYWNVLIRPETIGVGDIPELIGSLRSLNGDMRATEIRPLVQTELDGALETFLNQAGAVRPPLIFLTAEIVLLALYYVTMVAALAARQVEREFAVMSSRGASAWQIFRMQLGEALLVSTIAFVSGPVLGVALVRGLALVGPLADVGQANWPLTVTGAAWLAAAIGAAACVAGLMLPVGPAVRRSVVAHQQEQARAPSRPWWQRAYLDVLVLAIGLALLWRLHIYGGIVGGSEARPRVDWLLLLSPLALLLGAGTILLRLFPLVVRGLAGISGRGRGLPAALAMWQLSRNPTHVARLVLLLTLAMALGVLSTGLNATLDLSEFERAYYSTGSDMRVVSSRAVPLGEVDNLPEIGNYSGVWRGRGSISLGRLFGSLDVLAVEPYSLAALTVYRDDFASQPMGKLLGELVAAGHATQPLTELPGRPSTIGVWLYSPPDPPEDDPFSNRSFATGDSDLDRVGLDARLQTALGEILNVDLAPSETGGYPEDGWRFFSGDVPPQLDNGYPLAFHSLWLQNRIRNDGPFVFFMEGSFLLGFDDLAVTDGITGETSVVEGFDALDRVWQTNLRGRPVAYDPQNARSGRASLHLDALLDSLGYISIGLARPGGELRVPALASPTFMEATQSEIGGSVRVLVESLPVEFQIVGLVSYFPTMYERERAGFLITSRDPLLDYINRYSSRPVNVNEVFLASADGVGGEVVAEATNAAAAQLSNVTEIVEAGVVRTAIKADPMALGLRSVTYFGYVLTTALSLVGFATYFYMSARQREATYGVLRSIGMSPRQLYGMLALEQVVLIVFGLSLGTALGVILNQITLPGLPITLGERAPIPPFRVQSDWLAVGRIYLALTAAFLVSLGLATALLWRTQLHRVLRIGEE